MPNNWFYIIAFLLLSFNSLYSQETESDSLSVEIEEIPVKTLDTIAREPIDPLSPSRAAFYSAVLPGLGQAYNGRYWKIPIVIGAIGTGILVYDHNARLLERYRDAYKRRLAGFKDDEYYGEDENGNPLATPRIDNEGLIRAQQQVRRNKDLSLLVTIGIYALNIIDANVDAHLLQYNVDENLSLAPHIRYDEYEASTNLGLTLNLKF